MAGKGKETHAGVNEKDVGSQSAKMLCAKKRPDVDLNLKTKRRRVEKRDS